MGTCLITKLKGMADSSLLKFGEVKLKTDLTGEGNKGFLINILSGKTAIADVEQGAVLTIDGNAVTTPYSFQHKIGSDYYTMRPSKNGQDFVVSSLCSKYDITYLLLQNTVPEAGLSFNDIEYLQNLVSFGLYFSAMEGSFLNLAKLPLFELTIDRPSAKYEDGDIKQYLNARASLGTMPTQGYFRMAGRPAEGHSDYVTNYPTAMAGTYQGLWCEVRFTDDTTTCPGGWYIKSPGGIYYNSLDQVITPPNP